MTLKNYLRHLYGEDTVKLINRIQSTASKITRTKNHIIFLLRCRDNKLIPTGLKLKSPYKSKDADKILQDASKKLLRERINHYRKTRSFQEKEQESLMRTVFNTLTEQDNSTILELQERSTNLLNSKIRDKQLLKFSKLKTTQQSCNKGQHDNDDYDKYIKKTVHNYSDRILTKDETKVLAKGLSYIPTTKKSNTDEYITSIEQGLQQLAPGGNVNYLRYQIKELLKRKTHTHKKKSTNLSKKKWLAI